MRIRLIAALMSLALMVSLFAGCYTYEEVVEEVITNPSQVTESKKDDAASKTSSKKTSSKKTSSKKTTSKKTTSNTISTSKNPTYSYPTLERKVLYPSGWISNAVVMAKPSESETVELVNDHRYDNYTGYGTFGDELFSSLSKNVWNDNTSTIYDVIAGQYKFQGPTTLWPYGGYLEAAGAAYEYDETDTLYKDQYMKALRNVMRYEATTINKVYNVEEGTYLALTCYPGAPTAQLFYDDDIWIVKEFFHAYELGVHNEENPKEYLVKGQRMLKYICETAWDETWKGIQPGGLLWQDPNYDRNATPQKNSCINAPAAAAAVEYYLISGDETYLAHSEKIYAWAYAQLLDQDDHLMMDRYELVEGIPTLFSVKIPYNTGCMISASLGLYEAYKDKSPEDAELYYTDAKAFAQASIDRWLPEQNVVNNISEEHITNAWNYSGPWFCSYVAEGLKDMYELYESDKETYAELYDYVLPFRSAMALACTNRAYTEQGWFCLDLKSTDYPTKDEEKNIQVIEQSAIARMLFMAGTMFDDQVYKFDK